MAEMFIVESNENDYKDTLKSKDIEEYWKNWILDSPWSHLTESKTG